MVPQRRICVVSSSRADYGLLYWVMKEIKAAPSLQLQLVLTGSHLDEAFGDTWRAVEADGFRIDEKIPCLTEADTPADVARAIGLGTIGFGEALARLRPDLLLLLGDRYELLGAAQAALVANIPIAHIAGGDLSEGAFDDAIRHSLTKMSHLHFVTNGDAARRVQQLGEDPRYIFNFGSPGVDTLRRTQLLSRAALEQELGFRFKARNLLVTFHPVTLEHDRTEAHLEELLAALEALSPATGMLLTGSNADTLGRRFSRRFEAFAKSHANAAYFPSLGQRRYLSAMAQVDALVGNSSSALYEAPSFGRPAVNIGERQRGRLQPASVLNCSPERAAILRAVQDAFRLDCSGVVNPYGDGQASARIVATLAGLPDWRVLIRKTFHPLQAPTA
jgi:UDP-N-acetylglucosamine 2-epimerase (non-hydrolysing)/GDP/UDP-N,N'-diacetylbacillosamine 2-epimerase (hydrolysing)